MAGGADERREAAEQQPISAIVTLSLNPAIDSFATAEAVRPLRKIRTVGEHYHAGGGGIIVARVIGEMGRKARAIYMAGCRAADVERLYAAQSTGWPRRVGPVAPEPA